MCVDITIIGKSCLDSLEYSSSKKVSCLTPKVVGSGLIIITTLSGGRGSCNVSFTGLEAETAHLLGEQGWHAWREISPQWKVLRS